jgi:hypothetical protein
MAAILLWEMAQRHINKRLGEDRMQSLLKELFATVSLTRPV